MHNIDEKVDDSFQAFLVDGADFTSLEEYPIIRNDMVPNTIPEKIMPFSKAITYQGDLTRTTISFYSPDGTFERVRRNPARYLSFFKRTAGILGLDFSIHSDMPVVKQKSQINDNLSLSFYFAQNNIPLYPNARCGSSFLEDEYLAALPNDSLIVLGVHGFVKENSEKYEWLCWISKVIETLHPSGLIIVGHLTGNIFDEIKKRTPFYFYDSFMEERSKEAKDHVN